MGGENHRRLKSAAWWASSGAADFNPRGWFDDREHI